MEAPRLAREEAPNTDTIRAAAELLLDPSPRVHRVCEEQLLVWGESSRAALQRLCECDDPAARARVRRVLRTLDVRSWVEQLRAFASEPHVDLEAGIFLLSRLPRPLFDERSVVHELDRWAESLRPRLRSLGQRRLVSELAKFFHRELGFRGDRRYYYDPDNTFLDQVIRRRRGIPISMCALYLLVGRRLDLPLEGVGLPGHFILRLRGARSLLLDPFHGGRIVTRRDCIDRLQAMGYGFQESLLDSVSDRRMLIRCLGNLLHTFGFGEDKLLVGAVQAARNMLASGG